MIKSTGTDRKSFTIKITSLHAVILLLVAGYSSVAVWLGPILKFEFMQSDVLAYWENSLEWRTPFNLQHVPGYPLALALVRGLTFNSLPPLALMMGVNLVAFLACAFLTYRIIEASQVSEGYALAAAVLFSLFPFMGTVNAVYPLADLPSIALFLAGLFALQRSKTLQASTWFGLALFTHKGIWIFVAFTLIAYLVSVRPRMNENLAAAFLILAAPLLLLWLFGTIYHKTPTWIFSTDLGQNAQGMDRLPVLDGLIGTLRLGGLRSLVKGSMLYTVFLGSIILLWANLRYRPPYFPYGAAISAAVLISSIIINTPLAWAVVRYARILVLPLFWLVGAPQVRGFTTRFNTKLFRTIGMAAGIILLLTSQFAFAWYMAAVYYD